jgi:hypothetical protein
MGMAIVTLLIGAVGSALIVSLRTTGVTNQRLAENHDVQITSSYLANDVQSAAALSVDNATTDCSSAFTTLVTFRYWAPGNPPTPTGPNAVYECGTAGGETQVTRTFKGTTVIVAHFAGAARPDVTVAYDPSQPTVPVSVKMTFTKASDCTLDCTYTLFGARRSFNPASVAGVGGQSPPVTLLSTGTSSPLWVQGGATCPDPGTTTDCDADPTATGSPVADVATGGWTTTPPSPATLWDKLSDRLDTTLVTTSGSGMAQVALTGVSPPGGTPTIEFRAASPNTGQPARFEIHIYDATTMQELAVSSSLTANSNVPKNFDWQLTTSEANGIPDTAYQHLALGFKVTNSKLINVYGIALNTNPAGLLTIKGSLFVNSRNLDAVRLTGKKNLTKLTVSPGKFKILGDTAGGFGGCSGCSAQTVSCSACPGGWQPEAYSPSLLDPLRLLPAPDPSSLPVVTCSGSACPPGVYNAVLSRTSNTTLSPGIYYLKNGMSITGTASLTCPAPCAGGVMLYIENGSVTLAGGSTIDLTPPSTGIYTNIVIFQSRTDSSPLKIAGSAGKTTPINFRGIIYVPNSTQVTLATGSATLNALAIVAQNIKVSSPVTLG